MSEIQLEVITPKGQLLSATVKSVAAPGAEGEFAVLPEHRPALIRLGGGAVRYEAEGSSAELFIRGGVAEVQAQKVLILADEALSPEALEHTQAEEILASVQRALSEPEYLSDEQLSRLGDDRAYAEAMLRSLKG